MSVMQSNVAELVVNHEAPKIRPLNPPMRCPCCGAEVEAPTLEMVIDKYDLPPHQSAILAAAWKRKGHRVETSILVDAMYARDPDGGPEYEAAYRHFKVTLCLLRQRLKGSGVWIETVPYRRGYRLVLGGEDDTA